MYLSCYWSFIPPLTFQRSLWLRLNKVQLPVMDPSFTPDSGSGGRWLKAAGTLYLPLTGMKVMYIFSYLCSFEELWFKSESLDLYLLCPFGNCFVCGHHEWCLSPSSDQSLHWQARQYVHVSTHTCNWRIAYIVIVVMVMFADCSI